MTITGTAKRYRTYSKRKIRWDRVLTCTCSLVITFGLVRGMTTRIKSLDHAEGTNGGIIDENTNDQSSSTATDYSMFDSTTTESTTQNNKNIVVDESAAGFKLKLKTSAQDMGITGIYWSSKLQRIICVRDLQILAMLVIAEGAYEPLDAQVGIASTVLNRVLYDEKMFPDDIEKVVTQPHQFSPVIMKNSQHWYDQCWNGFYHNKGKEEVIWTDYPEAVRNSVLKAVYSALDGTDSTECVGGALYYCNMSQLSHKELEYRTSIGDAITYGSTTFYREWR